MSCRLLFWEDVPKKLAKYKILSNPDHNTISFEFNGDIQTDCCYPLQLSASREAACGVVMVLTDGKLVSTVFDITRGTGVFRDE